MNKLCLITNKECEITGCTGDVCILAGSSGIIVDKQQPPAFANYGWICPVCGRGNSPYTSTCPCHPVPYLPIQ